ncbi:Por secretion system C-terminal sorting domain-containing protein [Cyclobacterium xiamenense]|uniref:Por secretion system C-terminal sorting domain-containing protein n=1 Tax=Cyclobacterium xiamenense TaxID=1297121 RepID=A0A1H6ZQG5_9BACT|nr:T9SS type A sorting domain-containing protein [Cyclobacterium xiamenense]SEJ54926.1 Por secretion system C-terminal sorting domain-containing protein [Cyclobacterium xiamenense]
MKQLGFLVSVFLGVSSLAFGQYYTSYFTGNTHDETRAPAGGVCLMGGATEDDRAMTWFLQRANGGDVLVLRTSGSDGYNQYLYSELGVPVNSVETLVFHQPGASEEAYIHQKILQAEAIWFAGGDQWEYITYWRTSPIARLINEAIANRNVVIGGSSAGMAILGGFYFSAENGTVSSGAALSNPFDRKVTVDSLSFISNPYLSDVITDTHYDNPTRKGRHLVFLARILMDYGIEAKGIACDEYTAVCIDASGIARVFGGHPAYDDNAYFIQTNCELPDVLPENCSPGQPLDWNRGGKALRVYAVKGTSEGANSFDLTDWETGRGGVWEYWYVDQGRVYQKTGRQPNCEAPPVAEAIGFLMYPNPASDYLWIRFANSEASPESLIISNERGQVIRRASLGNEDEIRVTTSGMTPGMYLIRVRYADHRSLVKKLLIR